VKTVKIQNYTGAILLTVLGIVMIFMPEQVMNFICYAIAAVLICMGIVQLVTYASKDIKEAIYGHNLSAGIMLIICGVMFIIKSDLIQNLVPMIMGLIIIASGIQKLQHAINLMRFKSTSSTFVLIISILCIGIGAVLLFTASTVTKIITMIIGVGFVVSGLSDIATYIVMSKKVKEKTNFEDVMNNVSDTVENPEVVDACVDSQQSYEATNTEQIMNESDSNNGTEA